MSGALSKSNGDERQSLRILIATDKFKGSMSSQEICEILGTEIKLHIPDAEVELCPLADGGDGSIKLLANHLNLERRSCQSVDPLGRSIETTYYVSDEAAFIELANASGLVLLDEDERNPLYTSTFGTGLQIWDALEQGFSHVHLFLGGSGTHDGGIGIASALGYLFFDEKGEKLPPIGASLNVISRIVPPTDPIKIKHLNLYFDVTNITLGQRGAAYTYAKQKGANDEEILILDLGLTNLCRQVETSCGIDCSKLIGGGAAGGVAVCLTGFFETRITSGFDMISKTVNLESKIAKSDLVISGEGKLDSQSLDGKVVSGVASKCSKLQKPLWLVAGRNDLLTEEINELGADNIFTILELAEGMDDAITHSRKYLKWIGQKIAQAYVESLSS